jgi:hypothetical protein
MRQALKQMAAKVKSLPPSLLKLMPMINKWVIKAPDMIKTPRIAPSNVVFGIRMSMHTANSMYPRINLPEGSASSIENK